MGSYHLENISLGVPLLRSNATDDQDIVRVSDITVPTNTDNNISIQYDWDTGGSVVLDLEKAEWISATWQAIIFRSSGLLASAGQTKMRITLSGVSASERPPTSFKFHGVKMQTTGGASVENCIFEHDSGPTTWRIVKEDGSAFSNEDWSMSGFQIVYYP